MLLFFLKKQTLLITKQRNYILIILGYSFSKVIKCHFINNYIDGNLILNHWFELNYELTD